MFSSTSRHAIRALIILAQLPEGEFVQAAALARRIKAPANYLGKTLQAMCKQGLLRSRKGHGGGFRLACEPQRISLYDIIEPIEDLGRNSDCILGKMLCSGRWPCPAHKRYRAVMTALERFLKETTVGQLAERYAKAEGKKVLGKRLTGRV